MVGIIIQARMGSSRLPGKTMKLIDSKPLLYYSVRRSMLSKYSDIVVVATSEEPQDDIIENWCKEEKINCYRGSHNDVLDRYYQASKLYSINTIIRVTADNPFTDPTIIDMLILYFQNIDVDYASTRVRNNTYPYGLDVEVFSYKALKKSWNESKKEEHREHVTQYILQNPNMFKVSEISNTEDYSNIRRTVDTQDDFEKASNILNIIVKEKGIGFNWKDII